MRKNYIYRKNNPDKLSVSFWNIRGLTYDKLTDDDFKKYLKTDIIAFTESFTDEDSNLSLTGYVVDQLVRKHQNEHRTRSSGGIVVHIKSDISQGIDYIKSEHSDIMWLKVKKQFFKIENDLFIGVIYISPKNSSNVKHKQDTYQILEKELSFYSGQGDIMLGGDFNSRLGKNLTGKFTCFAYNGNSTVDLVLAPNTVKQKIITLRFYPLLNSQITVS